MYLTITYPQVVTFFFFQHSLLIQFRMHYDGYAVKKSFLLNNKVNRLSFMEKKNQTFNLFLVFLPVLSRSFDDQGI